MRRRFSTLVIGFAFILTAPSITLARQCTKAEIERAIPVMKARCQEEKDRIDRDIQDQEKRIKRLEHYIDKLKISAKGASSPKESQAYWRNISTNLELLYNERGQIVELEKESMRIYGGIDCIAPLLYSLGEAQAFVCN